MDVAVGRQALAFNEGFAYIMCACGKVFSGGPRQPMSASQADAAFQKHSESCQSVLSQRLSGLRDFPSGNANA